MRERVTTAHTEGTYFVWECVCKCAHVQPCLHKNVKSNSFQWKEQEFYEDVWGLYPHYFLHSCFILYFHYLKARLTFIFKTYHTLDFLHSVFLDLHWEFSFHFYGLLASSQCLLCRTVIHVCSLPHLTDNSLGTEHRFTSFLCSDHPFCLTYSVAQIQNGEHRKERRWTEKPTAKDSVLIFLELEVFMLQVPVSRNHFREVLLLWVHLGGHLAISIQLLWWQIYHQSWWTAHWKSELLSEDKKAGFSPPCWVSPSKEGNLFWTFHQE